MEKVKKLRSAFILYVAIAFFIVVLLSGIVILACLSIRKWLLPVNNELMLNVEYTCEDGSYVTVSHIIAIGEDYNNLPILVSDAEKKALGDIKYSVSSFDTNYTALSPKRRLLYQACGVAMIAAPLLFSIAGILVCGLIFYKKRLEVPIDALAGATEKIKAQDLDFEITSPSSDELGALCESFEQMRQALYKNNRRMWEMLEERKKLQASVAHDLRNPIAIIESHAEYLQINIKSGNMSDEKIASIAGNIEKAALRLNGYTESIRTINRLEELEIEKKPINFFGLFLDLSQDFTHMAALHNISLKLKNDVYDKTLSLDTQILYRVIENLIGNAVRYAKNEIILSFSCDNRMLRVTITDDGCGFSENILKGKNDWFAADSGETEHLGIGLTICRILCKKHGGELSVGNNEKSGACVKFSLAV